MTAPPIIRKYYYILFALTVGTERQSQRLASRELARVVHVVNSPRLDTPLPPPPSLSLVVYFNLGFLPDRPESAAVVLSPSSAALINTNMAQPH